MSDLDLGNSLNFNKLGLKKLISQFEIDDIKFACIFGSIARKMDHHQSDLDIAIFAGKTKRECFKLHLKYAQSLNLLKKKG